MDKKEIKITIPKEYEIDKENSTFEKIVFKKKEVKRWRDNKNALVNGYFVGMVSGIQKHFGNNIPVFATEKQAKAALAMARISQIMANDKRFGGVVTDTEWNNCLIDKYVVNRRNNQIVTSITSFYYDFLSFHTIEQCDLFLDENMDLVKDYLMIE